MIPRFKAFTKQYGMVDVLEINFRFKMIEFHIYVDKIPYAKTEYIGDIELLQSTGLKDKNGVEIYEGDVVHLTSNNGIDYKALIIFKDGGFCAVDGMNDYSTRRYSLHKGDFELEIIGNQFQHPHLLEE